MKTHISYSRICIAVKRYISLLVVLMAGSFSLTAQEGMDKYFMGIELNGVLCGYSEVFVTPAQPATVPYQSIDQKTFISFKALGRDISQRQVFTYHIDPANGNFIYHDSHTEQGEQKMGAAMTVKKDSIYIQAEGQEGTSVYLP